MLVLTRKKSQLIQIGDNIVIKVIRTGPGTVKLGIEAPSDVRVMRGELDEKLTQRYHEEEEADERPLGRALAARKKVTAPEATGSDRNLAELVEEEEPVSHVSRKRTRGCVA